MPSTPPATPAVSPAFTPPGEPDRAAPAAAGRHAQLTRAFTLGAMLALIGLCLAWELWLARTGSGTWAIKVLPLLLPLPGLWRYRLYTYRWLSLLIWLYVCEGLVRATSEPGLSAGLAWGEVALSVGIFAACVLHIRGRLHRVKLAPQPDTSPR